MGFNSGFKGLNDPDRPQFVKTQMSTKQWWSNTDWGKFKYWGGGEQPVTVPILRSYLTENTAYPIRKKNWTIRIAETKAICYENHRRSTYTYIHCVGKLHS